MSSVHYSSAKRHLSISAPGYLERNSKGSQTQGRTETYSNSVFMGYFNYSIKDLTSLKNVVPLAMIGLGVSFLLGALAAMIKIVSLSLLVLPVLQAGYEGWKWMAENISVLFSRAL